VIKDLVKNEGLIGLYKGYSASLVLCSLGIVQMVCYEASMQFMKNTTRVRDSVKAFISGCWSRFVASTILYPVTTVRSRIQKRQYTMTELRAFLTQHEEVLYRNMFDCFAKTWAREGFYGFYKGYAPTIIKAVPQQGIFFVLYEGTLRFLSHPRS
jgi:hypothetical protein